MKKIMFNDHYGLTKAVLEGRKAMTRRIVPECRALDILRLWERSEGAVATGYEEKTQSFRFDYCPDKKRRISIDHLNLIPSYKVGEVVAVAQSYKDAGVSFIPCPDPQWGCTRDMPGYNNKMFVRADLMPHQLRITSIKVERLQDISDEDVYREGFEKETVNNGWGNYAHHWEAMLVYYDSIGRTREIRSPHPRDAFAALIDKISGKGTWEMNPFVFVYSFELVK